MVINVVSYMYQMIYSIINLFHKSYCKVGICELPFHPVSSEVIGGVGGT